MMENWLPILGAIGLGSTITVLVQSAILRRDKTRDTRFLERKEAYFGFWEAMHRSEVERDKAAAQNVGLWVKRCQLVGSDEIGRLVLKVIDTDPASADRSKALSQIVAQMRLDLHIN